MKGQRVVLGTSPRAAFSLVLLDVNGEVVARDSARVLDAFEA